jgi:tetratricopeptide (TPR) repeat protein
MRHSLGAVLLDAGRPEQAEDAYRDDLKKWPANGWSLYGLMRSLRAQGRGDEARLVEKQYLKAFARADIVLTSTRF